MVARFRSQDSGRNQLPFKTAFDPSQPATTRLGADLIYIPIYAYFRNAACTAI